MIILAVVTGGLGYAEGGALARKMGGARVIAWALVIALPLLLPAAAMRVAVTGWPTAHWPAWVGFSYVSVVSMFLGFFAWYRGLALGGVARVGQLQLAQPVLTFAWSAILLDEPVTLAAWTAAAVVLLSVITTQSARARL